MKTSKLKITINVIIIIFTIGGAATLNAFTKISLAPLEGYITNASYGVCSITVLCGYGETICTVMFQGQAYQAYGKNFISDPVCTMVLYSPN